MALQRKPFEKPPILDINAEDPEIPYSGGSSAAFINDELNKPAVEEKKKQKQQRSDLLPVADDIFKFLNLERTAIGDIRSYKKSIGEHPTAEQITNEYEARVLYLDYLTRFEQWMVNRLSKTQARR